MSSDRTAPWPSVFAPVTPTVKSAHQLSHAWTNKRTLATTVLRPLSSTLYPSYTTTVCPSIPTAIVPSIAIANYATIFTAFHTTIESPVAPPFGPTKHTAHNATVSSAVSSTLLDAY